MKSTFSRTFAAAAVILLTAVVLLGTIFPSMVKDYLTEQTVSGLRDDAEVISNLATAYTMEGTLDRWEFMLNLNLAADISDSDVVICNADGRIVICTCPVLGCDHLGMDVDDNYLFKVLQNGGDSATGVIHGLYEESRYVVSVPIVGSDEMTFAGIVIVSTPTAATIAMQNRIFRIFMITGLAAVFLAIIGMSLFARNHSFPLKEMARTANAFGHGDLDARVRLYDSYSEEVEELALAFNNMASILQKSEYQRQEFVANVSHELKTPMTTISGYVDGILDGTIPENRHRYYLQIVSDETKRLSRLVRSMLDISKLQDQQVPEEQKIHFDLEECCGQVLITFEKKITDKHLEVDVDMPLHPVYTIANQDAVTQVIYNLLDNAVKFCPDGGTLGLKIREGGGKVYISISNTGQTIPSEELPLVFDRFHKIDKARTTNRDGWGLGLYIVKTIVCAHGENISVSSKDGKTEFTFTMPLVN